MKTYLVGGAVRDALLGHPVIERDWVVVGATDADMRREGFQPLDAQFPVYIHPSTGDEYALARTEIKTGPGYKGFSMHAGSEITLEQDLARRDLTINAIAQAPDGRLIDPYGGQADLQARLLRHVTPAFVEDPVRLLRIARFAATLGAEGFSVSDTTSGLLGQMALSEDLAHLRVERVWREMNKALAAPQPYRFFEVLAQAGALAALLPELAERRQPAAALAALRKLVGLEDEADPAARFAATFADLTGLERLDALCARFRVPSDYADLLRRLVELRAGLSALAASPGSELLAFFHSQRAFQLPQRIHQMMTLCRALDEPEAALQRIAGALEAASAVAAQTLLAEGLQGTALRSELDRRRAAAIDKSRVRGG